MRSVPRVATGLVLVVLLFGTDRASAQATGPGDRPPATWAVVVGVQRYADPAIPESPGAIREARDLATWLEAEIGRDHVRLLHDGGDRRPGAGRGPLEPSAANLRWATGPGLDRARKGDLVVIAFAGQAAATGVREVLLPIDARASDLARSGWTPEAALDDLSGRRGCRVVCWLDTSLHGRTLPVSGSKAEPGSADRLLDRLTRWPGTSAWLAAVGKPAAADPSGPSPFARSLRKGLEVASEEPARGPRRLAGRPHAPRPGVPLEGGSSPLAGLATLGPAPGPI